MLITTIAGWTGVGVVALVLATELAGWCPSVVVAVLQALTPFLLAVTVFATIAGRTVDDPALFVAGLLTTVGVAATVAPALRRHRPAATAGVDANGPSLRVLHANLLFTNVGSPRSVAAAVLATRADVLALSELNPVHERALREHPQSVGYPYRVGRSSRGSDGMAIWSTLPLVRLGGVAAPRATLLARVVAADSELRLVVAHPNPPTTRRGLREWGPTLAELDRVGRTPGPPTMIVADLNATRWHPPLRRMLHAGWRDAHESVGRGLSTSWPTTRRWLFPFVRLDHALLGDGVTALAADDVEVPGSDHRAFVVLVAVSPISAPHVHEAR